MVEQIAIDGVIAELTALRKDRPGLVPRLDKMIVALGGTVPPHPATQPQIPAKPAEPAPSIPAGDAGH